MPDAQAFLKPHLVSALRRVNQLMRAANRYTHGLQARIEWGWPPPPEWFDHYLGTHYMRDVQTQSIQEERGVYATLAIPIGGRILDLCCGDGWHARHFYAQRAASIVAVDFDPDAIAFARRVNGHPAVRYEVADIRVTIPEGPFDTIVCSGAIEHFTRDETADVLRRLQARLVPDGVLAGDTILAAERGRHLVHHEFEYSSEEALLNVLVPTFSYACAWRSDHPGRTELYFFAADDEAALPLGRKIARRSS